MIYFSSFPRKTKYVLERESLDLRKERPFVPGFLMLNIFSPVIF